MALISCPDCGTQVSDRAPTCPKCGAPIAGSSEAAKAGALLTTVQQTSKRLKAHILVSGGCVAVGLLWAIIAIAAGSQPGASPPSDVSLVISSCLF